ncbi:hypothetical protein PRZ48_013040 [Zasmidium cellare]|uniref:Uncharacterized protein n=1 Tax=Zasmidium cellare TaxID=395010 RepID=A0ABR0E2X2_ZASCE|nr:hypothetical protein PRZ48_013040 [Zasmidium cellare]
MASKESKPTLRPKAAKAAKAPKGPKFRVMVCGKHARPRKLPYIPEPGFDGQKRYTRYLQPGQKRGGCLCDYYDYPQLLHERMHVRPNVKKPKKPFPLLKLPAELRNKVYEFAVTADEAIEFCPEPYFYTGLGTKHRREGDWHDDFDRAKAHHKQAMKQAARSAALIRVNKQLRSEVTPIFYGENEFRFSNITGWIGLDFFLYKLGLNKCKMLRKISVCHPDCVRMPKSLTEGADFDDGSPFLPLGQSNDRAFNYETRWFDLKITTDPALVLQKAGKLKQLRLVSPANTHNTFDYNPFDLKRFKDLEVSVVSLRYDKFQIMGSQAAGYPWMYKNPEAAKTMAEHHLEKTGEQWKYADIVIDEYGRY